jgi:hypothetical protein
MRLKDYMDSIEGEQVARQTNRNRELTQIDANLWERGRPDRRVRRPAEHIPASMLLSEAGRETRPEATETVALPANRISKYSRLFASIPCHLPAVESFDCSGWPLVTAPWPLTSWCKSLISSIVSDISISNSQALTSAPGPGADRFLTISRWRNRATATLRKKTRHGRGAMMFSRHETKQNSPLFFRRCAGQLLRAGSARG